MPYSVETMKALYGSILLLFVIVGASVLLSSQEGFYATAPSAPAAPLVAAPLVPVASLVPSPALVPATKTLSSAPLAPAASHAPAALTSPSEPSVVPLSEMGYEAMTLKQRSNLLKDIQKMVRTELLSSRQFDSLHPTSEAEDNTSVRQGQDYQRRCQQDGESEEYRCPKNPDGSCPPVPDLSDYVRKDSIPCWGCSLK